MAKFNSSTTWLGYSVTSLTFLYTNNTISSVEQILFFEQLIIDNTIWIVQGIKDRLNCVILANLIRSLSNGGALVVSV